MTTAHSLRTRAAIAAGKAARHARTEDGEWDLGVFIDAILAITEADKAEAVRAALAEHQCGWREIKRGEECPHCDDLEHHPGGPCGDYYGEGGW